jgi:D-beta-D-heptose 7-phosphate kinase/D-beta-D-heptose 1-phosphate adenosyltransferase
MSDTAAISDLIANVGMLSSARVLVVGDIMLDHYALGTVGRISPEAPIPVLNVEREYDVLGGAGNVLRNLAAIGTRAAFVGAIGPDAAGERVRELVANTIGERGRLVVTDKRQTPVKTRHVAGGHQLLRVDCEDTAAVTGEVAAAIVDEARVWIDEVDAVILSDYRKGCLTPPVLFALIEAARHAGRVVIVDPKGPSYLVYRGADLLTPNRHELREASGLPTGSDDEIVAASHHVINACGVRAVLATRGAQGMSLVNRGDVLLHLRAQAREVYDVAGAGDTVVAVMGAGLAAGLCLENAAYLANAAAGVVVGKVGTAVAYPDELARSLLDERLRGPESKIATLPVALDKVAVWRRLGLTIGFTNGCFDLLHRGHISLFHQAREACDRLVVGLNSDESVRRLKGPTRPVQSEMERAVVLASLADVDQVVIFAEDTPLQLIEAIRPDVLIKGRDYSREAVVGADAVESYHGRVILAELVPGASTTSMVSRLVQARGERTP